MLPSTVDGGPPIVRLPARIDELRATGQHIEHSGRRDRCAICRLVALPAPVVDPSPPAPDTFALFSPAVGAAAPGSPLDPETA